MKTILFTSLLFLFISCGIEYDGETKLVIKGKILLENNLPLTNHEVKLFVRQEASGIPFIFFIPSETNFIGRATTNANGEYTMVIPKPKSNNNEIIVEINSNTTFNKRQVRNIDIDDFSNFEILVATDKLYLRENLSQLFINLNQVNPNFQLISINYIGDYTNEVSFFKPLSDNYINIYNDLAQLVKKNQELVIQYEVKNMNTNAILTFQEVIFINDQDFIEYTINY
jgi:hypothetical protein